MASRTIYNCDICPTKPITEGVTMVFEIDQSGEPSAPKYRLLKTLKGLYPFHDAPKVTHICSICSKSIVNAKDPKELKPKE